MLYRYLEAVQYLVVQTIQYLLLLIPIYMNYRLSVGALCLHMRQGLMRHMCTVLGSAVALARRCCLPSWWDAEGKTWLHVLCQQAAVILWICSGIFSVTVSRYFGQVQYQSLAKSLLWYCDTSFFFFPRVGFFWVFPHPIRGSKV